MRGYVEFLRVPYAARLLGGTLLGRLPNGMALLAIVLHVRAEGGTYPLAGGLSAVFGLAMAAGQPVLGRAMDRYGQGAVLLPAAVASAAGFAVVAVVGVDPLPVTVAAVVVAGIATPPLEAGLRALWPDVLGGPAQVQAAYALDAAAQELLYSVGPLLVVGAALVSTEAALVLTGLLGIAGTLVVACSGPSRRWRPIPRAADWLGPLRSTGLRLLLCVLVFAGVALGVFAIGAAAYAERSGNDAASGVLLAAMAAGALVGGLAYGARTWYGDPSRRLRWLLAGLAAGYLPLVWAPGLALMVPLAFVSGIFLAPVLACCFSLVDGLAPAGTVTEAFAWIVAAVTAGGSLGSFAAGYGQEFGGVPGAFAGAAVGGLLALLLCLAGARLLHPRADAAAVAEPAAVR
ncbi:MFS transporter [Actinomadura flavalba]|uniref:MFS transporter n=1 Tax=Actinomadura flavalba TaxID=1120938 RepID=UPI000526BB26|nr:MFS transporter [Actinomadura flavalba]